MCWQLTCSALQHCPWCDQDVLQVPLCLKRFFLITLKGANFESYRLETLTRGFLNVWTMSLLDILLKILAFGVFLFSFKLAFPWLGSAEFSWFSWKDARFLVLFLYFISLNFLRWIQQLMAHRVLHWEHRMHQQLWHYYKLLFLHSCCLVFCRVPLKFTVQVSGSFQ